MWMKNNVLLTINLSMKKIIVNIVAVLVGLFAGAFVNGGIINISGEIIAPPLGANMKTMEGLIQAMPLMEPKHFIMPFLAHALGTLIGAILCSLIARSNQLVLSLSIGLSFFIGGFMMVLQLPAPLWFDFVDLIFAYFPMAWLGYWVVSKLIWKQKS
jgi:VIT1/CCC1 family predicted Fe2+/Mn2+ transporter